MQLKAFAKNADTCETARTEVSLLKSALFTTSTLNLTKFPMELNMELSNFQHGRVDFLKIGSERVNRMRVSRRWTSYKPGNNSWTYYTPIHFL